jgi:DNA-binding NtrC family response regulator
LPTLYYRLNVVRIELPPLKEPREDIPLIAEIFYDRVGRRPHSG